MTDLPRRQQMLLWHEAERQIQWAKEAVELAGADTRLTAALNLLHQAQERVADWVDGVHEHPIRPPQLLEVVAHPLRSGSAWPAVFHFTLPDIQIALTVFTDGDPAVLDASGAAGAISGMAVAPDSKTHRGYV